MNAVIDEDLPRSFTTLLSSLGWTVFDIRDHGLRTKSDELIFAFAQEQKAILFSADLGFSNIIQFPPNTHYGICVLRFPNTMKSQDINRLIAKILPTIDIEDMIGNLTIITPEKTRIRRASH